MELRSTAVPEGHRLVTIAEEPATWGPADRMCSESWPEFMLHDPVADRCWGHLRDDWPQFQLVLLDDMDQVAAAAQAAPLHWDGTDAGLPEGWDAQFEQSVAELGLGVVVGGVGGGVGGSSVAELIASPKPNIDRTPNTLGAIQICVARNRRGEGLSGVMLDAMRQTARDAGLRAVIACVRPTDKRRYPLMPIADYAFWRRPDGLPFDPWLRVHVRAGGRIVRPSPHSMTIAGTLAEWSAWTGLDFPVSGPYVVDGALEPVTIDVAADRGVYYDANVWTIHDTANRENDTDGGQHGR